MSGSGQTGSRPDQGAKWLRIAVIGSLLMAVGSLLIVGVHLQTRGDMREVLTETKGLIRTDGQMQVLNEIMTRGLLMSIAGLGVVVLGIILSIMGLFAFFSSRRRPAGDKPEAINAP